MGVFQTLENGFRNLVQWQDNKWPHTFDSSYAISNHDIRWTVLVEHSFPKTRKLDMLKVLSGLALQAGPECVGCFEKGWIGNAKKWGWGNLFSLGFGCDFAGLGGRDGSLRARKRRADGT